MKNYFFQHKIRFAFAAVLILLDILTACAPIEPTAATQSEAVVTTTGPIEKVGSVGYYEKLYRYVDNDMICLVSYDAGNFRISAQSCIPNTKKEK